MQHYLLQLDHKPFKYPAVVVVVVVVVVAAVLVCFNEDNDIS
jgi:hypothetical protein